MYPTPSINQAWYKLPIETSTVETLQYSYQPVALRQETQTKTEMCIFNCQIVFNKFRKANFLYKLTFKRTLPQQKGLTKKKN